MWPVKSKGNATPITVHNCGPADTGVTAENGPVKQKPCARMCLFWLICARSHLCKLAHLRLSSVYKWLNESHCISSLLYSMATNEMKLYNSKPHKTRAYQSSDFINKVFRHLRESTDSAVKDTTMKLAIHAIQALVRTAYCPVSMCAARVHQNFIPRLFILLIIGTVLSSQCHLQSTE